MLERGKRFNLGYVDGSHLFEDVFVDAYFIMRLLAINGVVAFDDSSSRHVSKVIQFLRTNLRQALKELDLTIYRQDVHSLPKRVFFYRIARHLGKTQLIAFQRVGTVEREWSAPLYSF